MSLECYNCNGNLKKGNARIHGTIGGFLIFGLSHENLYFKADDEKEIKILGSGGTTPALRCTNCGIVILNSEVTETYEPTPREILIEIFTVFASKELQESLKTAHPDFNIKEHLDRSWKEFYFPKTNEFLEAFSEEELKLLSEFNDLYRAKDWDAMEAYADLNLSLIANNH